MSEVAVKGDARARVSSALRALREARGLSVSELSRASGVAKATLSALEGGRANPTLDTLWSLAAALKVSLGELLDPPQPSVEVVRAGEGTVVKGASVVARMVGSGDLGGARYEIYDSEVRRRRQISPPHARGVIEHLFVSSGRLRAGPADRPLELGPGDYLRMSPTWPHLYEGLTAGTRVLIIMQYG
jgi:transcriptional regulator with XRE-family HTH domain